MIDGDKLEIKRAKLLPASGRDGHRQRSDAMFFEFCLNQGQGQRGANQGNIPSQPQKIGHRADVILMRVGQHDAEEVLAPFLDEVEIGKDQIKKKILLSEGYQVLVLPYYALYILEDAQRPAYISDCIQNLCEII